MTDPSALANRLDDLAGARVLILGDLMLDRFVYGSVDRISPEAPIPVVRVEHETAMPGGAGNVARNVAALGARAGLVAVAGDDDAGREVAALLDGEPGIAARIITLPGRPTTVKTRYMAAGQQLLRSDRESATAVAGGEAASVVEALEALLSEHDVLVLSDYAKGVLGEAVLGPAIAAARALGKPVIADPKGQDFGRYGGVTLLTPNRAELLAATGLDAEPAGGIAAAAGEIVRRHAIEALLVTLGARGMTLVRGEGAALDFPTESREVYDVSGAGDTVVAVLATALGAGLALEEAAQLANAAAGLVVGKLGTAVVHGDELAHALYGRVLKSAEAKFCTRDAALEKVEQWRRRGQRVGFTNGCFDLIHPGHVSLLEQAAAACDRLVVGLNSDLSANRLKGEGRPIQAEAARAAVLASLEAVDLVVVFAEETPIDLIAALRPDVLVKGADYSLEEVVGAELVQGWGGRVLLAEIAPGYSTTRTIAKLVG